MAMNTTATSDIFEVSGGYLTQADRREIERVCDESRKKGPCGNCGAATHALRTCMHKLTMEGFLPDCPWCNEIAHSWDSCKVRRRDRKTEFYFEVVLRGGRPSLEMKEDWRLKYSDYLSMGIEGCRWPWTKAFASEQRLKPHEYKPDPLTENYVYDIGVENLDVPQGTESSVHDKAPRVALAYDKAPSQY